MIIIIYVIYNNYNLLLNMGNACNTHCCKTKEGEKNIEHDFSNRPSKRYSKVDN